MRSRPRNGHMVIQDMRFHLRDGLIASLGNALSFELRNTTYSVFYKVRSYEIDVYRAIENYYD